MTEENTNQAPAPESTTQPQPQPAPQPMPAPQPQPAPQPMPAPQPQPASQPMYASPANQPMYAPAPLMQLSGGMKFGWLVVGALLGIPGIIIAWLSNVDKLPQVKSEALKYSIIGFVVWVVLGIILSIMITGFVTAAIMGAAGSLGGGSYDYGYNW